MKAGAAGHGPPPLREGNSWSPPSLHGAVRARAQFSAWEKESQNVIGHKSRERKRGSMATVCCWVLFCLFVCCVEPPATQGGPRPPPAPRFLHRDCRQGLSLFLDGYVLEKRPQRMSTRQNPLVPGPIGIDSESNISPFFRILI